MESDKPVVEVLLLVLEGGVRVDQGDPEDGAQMGGVGGGDGKRKFEIFFWRRCRKDRRKARVAIVEEKKMARQ